MRYRRISRRKMMFETARAVAGLTLTSAAAPYVIGSTALGGRGRPAASERITLGCIGVGSHGTMTNLRNFLE